MSATARRHAVAGPGTVVVVLCLGGLTAALTQTMVIPLQSDLPRLLHASASDTAWVVTITLLCAAIAVPIAGRVADIAGKRRVLTGTLAASTAGSLVCAMSDSLPPMLVGRGLHGVAFGFIPVAVAMIREVVPASRAATGIAAISATFGVGAAIGLPLSAWIVEIGDWHLAFWGLAAVGVVVLIAVITVLPGVEGRSSGRFDLVGALGLALGLSLLIVGMSKGSAWGWDSGRTLGSLVLGLLTIGLWVLMELRTEEPLVDVRGSAELPVMLTNVAGIAVGVCMMAHFIAVPQLLMLPVATGHGLGQTILHTGLWMAPGGLVMMFLAPVSGRLINTVGAKATLMLGIAVIGVGYAVALGLMTTPRHLLIASAVISTGVGIGYAAMPTLILDATPPSKAGSAVGVNTLMRLVGTTIASAAMGAVLTGSTQTFGTVDVPTEGAFQLCFLIGALTAAVALGIAALVPRHDAAKGALALTEDSVGVPNQATTFDLPPSY